MVAYLHGGCHQWLSFTGPINRLSLYLFSPLNLSFRKLNNKMWPKWCSGTFKTSIIEDSHLLPGSLRTIWKLWATMSEVQLPCDCHLGKANSSWAQPSRHLNQGARHGNSILGTSRPAQLPAEEAWVTLVNTAWSRRCAPGIHLNSQIQATR